MVKSLKGFGEIERLREDFNRAIQAFEKRFETIKIRFGVIEKELDNVLKKLDGMDLYHRYSLK